MHRSAVATRARYRVTAHAKARIIARRGGRFASPGSILEEGLMEAHASYENTNTDVTGLLQQLSQEIYAQVKDPLLRRALLAIVHQAIVLIKSRLSLGCSRLREITREVSGVAA